MNARIALSIAVAAWIPACQVLAGSVEDEFEDDDTFDQASSILVSGDVRDPTYHFGHIHTFHDFPDHDWIKFPVVADQDYEVYFRREGATIAAIDFHRASIEQGNTTDFADCFESGGSPPEPGVILFNCNEATSQVIFVHVDNVIESQVGGEFGFELRVGNINLTPPDPALIRGTVTDSVTGEPIGATIVRDDQGTATLSGAGGGYDLACGRGITQIDTLEGIFQSPDRYHPIIVDVVDFFSDPAHCPALTCLIDDEGELFIAPGAVLELNLSLRPTDLVFNTGMEDSEDFDGGASN